MAWGSGAALEAAGLYHSFFLSFFLLFRLAFCLSPMFRLSVGTKGSGGGAPPFSRLAQRRRGYQGPVIL